MAKKMGGQPSGYRNPNQAGPKIKVSQETINLIKKMGMKKALKEITMYGTQGKGLGPKGATMRSEGQNLLRGEFAEGVKRMYGARRFEEAKDPVAAKKKKVIATTTSQPAGYKNPAAAGNKPKPASTKYSPAPMTPKAKAAAKAAGSKAASASKKPGGASKNQVK